MLCRSRHFAAPQKSVAIRRQRTSIKPRSRIQVYAHSPGEAAPDRAPIFSAHLWKNNRSPFDWRGETECFVHGRLLRPKPVRTARLTRGWKPVRRGEPLFARANRCSPTRTCVNRGIHGVSPAKPFYRWPIFCTPCAKLFRCHLTGPVK